MKSLFAFFFLITSFFSFSQEALLFKSPSKVLNSDKEKLTPTEVRDLFATNPEALQLYNSGKSKQTLGNILLYGGIATVVTTHLIRVTDSKTIDQYGRLIIKERSNIPYFVGLGAILIAIPIKIGFSKKIKKAVSLINEDLRNPKTGLNIESTSLISNSNGLGISITF
jgi:hypothetical protein